MKLLDVEITRRAATDYTPELERHEFRCERCGYGAIACVAPSRCPICGASAWSISTGMREGRSDDRRLRSFSWAPWIP